MTDKRDRAIGAVQATAPGVGTGVGAAVGSVVPGVGTAVGAMLGGAAGSMVSGMVGLFRKPQTAGPGSRARAEEAMKKHGFEAMHESLSPNELSAMLTREREELDMIQAEITQLASNPNIAASTVMAGETAGNIGLRNIMARQRGLRGRAEIAGRQTQAERKTQQIEAYGDIAARNAAIMMRARAEAQQLRDAQLQSFGASVGSAAQLTAAAVAASSEQNKTEDMA